MASINKRKTASVIIPSKRTRKHLTLQVKLDIIKRAESGERASDIANYLSVPPTTIRTILKNKEKYQKYVMDAIPMQFKGNKPRSNLIVKMEKLLIMWIEDQTHRRMPLSQMLIQQKALKLYNDLKKDGGESSTSETFSASRGWFNRFKKRSGIHNVKLMGEAASADTEAATEFLHIFKAIVEDGGYTAQQVFNVDETGLFWKKMPSRSFISEYEKSMPGHKAAKDRLTLLLGGNAAGDFKLKPMLVYRSANPRALKNIDKHKLPVLWKSNKKAWMTKSLFQEWFKEYFVPAVTKYCNDNNLSNKALLILDNAPGHPNDLESLSNGNIKIVFLPPNTTSLLQPMDQIPIAMFKHYFLKRTFSRALTVTEGVTESSIVQFWKDHNILDAIEIIDLAWKDVSTNCLNGCWKKLWIECTKGYEETEETTPTIQECIVTMGKQLGFADLNTSDIQDLIDSHDIELTNEELIAIEQEIPDDENDISNEVVQTEISSEKIKEALDHLDKAKEIFSEHDVNVERQNIANRGIEKAIICYRELYKQLKKPAIQFTLDTFFSTSQKIKSMQQAIVGSSKLVPTDKKQITLHKYFSAGEKENNGSVNSSESD